MAKKATRTAVYTRIDPDTKEQAETVLKQLGISMSNAVGMFLRQVALRRGIPFEVKLPAAEPVEIDSLTKEQLDAEMQQGMDDI